MIPNKIRREHLLETAKIIERKGVPIRRRSTKHDVLVNGKGYPPKYLIAVASKLAKGKMISAQSYNGGLETNSLPRARDFKITNKSGEVISYP